MHALEQLAQTLALAFLQGLVDPLDFRAYRLRLLFSQLSLLGPLVGVDMQDFEPADQTAS
jgi:hypothetical protein